MQMLGFVKGVETSYLLQRLIKWSVWGEFIHNPIADIYRTDFLLLYGSMIIVTVFSLQVAHTRSKQKPTFIVMGALGIILILWFVVGDRVLVIQNKLNLSQYTSLLCCCGMSHLT